MKLEALLFVVGCSARPVFYCEPDDGTGAARLCIRHACPVDKHCVEQSEAVCAALDGEEWCFADRGGCEAISFEMTKLNRPALQCYSARP